ncbi:GGDEF domain-containing protein [Amorphus coralli]|uniref:GGDEF domain-containing protein n=1 Tax=Amorphus coralli TaxID=340680 RepID=UPI0005914C90|nr:GGDEF domain-containing protein [Amorphus coralli]
MILDIGTIMIMVGVTCGGLAVVTFLVWLSNRPERFLRTWSLGTLVLVGSTVSFGLFEQRPTLLLGWLAAILGIAGITVGWMAAEQLRQKDLPVVGAAIRIAAGIGATSAAALAGRPGTMMVIFDVAAFVLLLEISRVFWATRTESPVYLTGLAGLTALIGISFLSCGIALFFFEEPDFLGIPQTLVETLNGVITLLGLTGIGALCLALVHERIANRHRADAMTDSLTGLLNRRALLDIGKASGTVESTAVIIFDLDRFKDVNDSHGHAVGDLVLRRFTVVCRQALRATDLAARIGGEEFAVVLPGTGEAEAILVADRIRRRFQKEEIATPAGPLSCTVSAGVHASPPNQQWQLQDLLLGADTALYEAKNGGRNRVCWSEATRPH